MTSERSREKHSNCNRDNGAYRIKSEDSVRFLVDHRSSHGKIHDYENISFENQCEKLLCNASTSKRNVAPPFVIYLPRKSRV